MAQDRRIDIETAKKLLKNVCDFLEIDKSGIADFKITDGKEAVLMSLYTEAFFILNERYKFKFRPVADAFHSREPLTLIPSQKETWSSSEVVPIFAPSLSSYFKFFQDLNKLKFLLMVDGSKYRSSKGYFYPERIIEDMANKIKESGLNPTDCLIWHSDKDSTYGEDFWEYISGIVLRNKGYFVTYYTLGGGRLYAYYIHRSSWRNSKTLPSGADLYAYYIPDYIERLMKRRLLNKGAFIEELEMLEFLNIASSPKLHLTKTNFESVVIEAESSEMRTRSTSSNSGVGQTLKYLSDPSAGYTHGFVTGPFTKVTDICEKYREKIGLISCDEDGNLIFAEPEAYQKPQEEKIETIKNVIKCSLLRNLSFEERCKLIGIQPTNLKNYFEKILSLDIDVILDTLCDNR
jgi:hypothetical protein